MASVSSGSDSFSGQPGMSNWEQKIVEFRLYRDSTISNKDKLWEISHSFAARYFAHLYAVGGRQHNSMDAVAEMQRTNIAAYALRLYWWKSRKRRCHKALWRFALLRPGYRHGTPKPRISCFLCTLPKNRPKISAVLTARIALRVPL